MVCKGFRTLPQDLDQVLDSHGLRHQFEALSNEAKVMYLSWIGEVPRAAETPDRFAGSIAAAA